ncbi:MAG: glycoside hydrolase family 88 protein [Cephaloticoccus sp.]|nr:glycoside hydrolase family 88 protein [Cephaloticoccus sp.]
MLNGLCRWGGMAVVLLGLPCLAANEATANPAPMAMVVEEALQTATAQYEWMLAHLPDNGELPRTFEHGKLVTKLKRDWTVGFFPGSLWYLYAATAEPKWRIAAEHYTALIAAEQFNTRTHDVGFILYCSFGNGYRLTKQEAYRAVLLQGAKSLGTRFDPVVGSIKSWDRDPKRFTFPVIIDNMMNLELLLWAAVHGGVAGLREIAVAHADTTLRYHFRPDGSSFHVVDYDAATGGVLRRLTHQGAADDSAWARGQAWGLYGFTFMYRETHDVRYLAQAEKIAAFLMNHPRMPADKIPYWDFDAPGLPNVPRDTSAAAIMSSALFELARLTKGSNEAERYAGFAGDQLRALASPAYLARPGENGGFLLMHATGNLPGHSEVDVPLNYGDYYFLEALLRCRARLNPQS